jgi:hypothetical protein
VTIFVQVDASAMRVFADIGVRVGMLLGRYLDDPALVRAVAEHVAAGWLGWRGESSEPDTVEQWWDSYVELVEATVGGADCATDDDLRRVWADHARRLMAANVDD